MTPSVQGQWEATIYNNIMRSLSPWAVSVQLSVQYLKCFGILVCRQHPYRDRKSTKEIQDHCSHAIRITVDDCLTSSHVGTTSVNPTLIRSTTTTTSSRLSLKALSAIRRDVNLILSPFFPLCRSGNWANVWLIYYS